MCFADFTAAAQCEELHEDYLFSHLQLILLVHAHKLLLLLSKNYTETLASKRADLWQRFPSKWCSTTADIDVKENSFRLEDSGRLFFKAIQIKAMDDIKIKITENMNTTSYFMGKAVLLLVNDQTSIKKKFQV